MAAEVPVIPSVSCLVLTTPGAGEGAFGDLLAQIAGIQPPRELFERARVELVARLRGASAAAPSFLDEYLNDAIAVGTAPTGLFAATILWPQFLWLVDAVRSIPCAGPSQSDGERLSVWFANPRYVHLSRRDHRRQAVALCGDTPDPARINDLVNCLRAQDRSWCRFFARHSISALEVCIEDLLADPQQMTKQVVEFLDLPPLGKNRQRRRPAAGPPPKRDRSQAPRERCQEFPWELGYIVDGELRDVGFAVIRGRITGPDDLQTLDALARDHQMIGMTCQGVFPMIGGLPGNLPDDRGPLDGLHEPCLGSIEGWAHCFRNPDDFLPSSLPRILFSNSDNINPDWIWDIAHNRGPVEKRWDFIYSCMPEPSNFRRKNWELAKVCAVRFAEELGLRGLLVGVDGVAGAPDHPLIELAPKLPWRKFIGCLARSRVAFFPNTWDPCPRVMAEAMCLDVPLLVNREILGGWKYVCAATGSFFSDDEEAIRSIGDLMSTSLAPRDWFGENYGPQNAGRRLAKFLREISGGRTAEIERPSFFSPRDYQTMPRARRPEL